MDVALVQAGIKDREPSGRGVLFGGGVVKQLSYVYERQSDFDKVSLRSAYFSRIPSAWYKRLGGSHVTMVVRF